MKTGPTALIILDGYGLTQDAPDNAVSRASTPYLHTWWHEFPHAVLQAAGTAVGLPEGYIGNSEVGHLTIGAGRIINQTITRLNTLIDDGKLCENKSLHNKLNTLRESEKSLHIIGLISDAGVHAHINHIIALLNCAAQAGLQKIYIHAITDGRDVPPRTAELYLAQLEDEIAKTVAGSIASISGRFYAMDRDNNWSRTQEALDVLVTPTDTTRVWRDALYSAYGNDQSDEFIKPQLLDPTGTINSGDGVIIANFRADRIRQLTKKLLELPVAFVITPVAYSNELATTTLLESEPITNTLFDVLHAHDKTIFAIAETEKYAHVTYFINGGRDEERLGETRVLIPSIRAKTYEERPCMSAREITDAVLNSLQTAPKDFYLINYANADMVGHSGNFDAAVKALECIDPLLGELYDQVVKQMNGTLYITADHGNAEEMADRATGQPRTAHTINPVPFIMLRQDLSGDDSVLPLTGLKDIKDFILKNMGIE